MRINDLPQLENILDTITPEDEPRFFNDEESLELYETCIHMMGELIIDNPKLITDPDFDDIFDENINELMHSHFDFDLFYTEEAEDEMDEIIEQAKKDFFKEFMPIRSHPTSCILEMPDYDYITEQLIVLRQKPQPLQRTKEWYESRHNLITASNAYKGFESQLTKNQLIYEKCQPLNSNLYINDDNDDDEDTDVKEINLEQKMVNVNTTLHWGQKYEPLSIQIYEHMYNTKIEDFGCIRHDNYLFLGASPDGINVDISSSRYGRMLEIKNIVNREIDGIPKKEYWIQMQLQMEVCDLEECDFLETRFTEYLDFESYKTDSPIKNEQDESINTNYVTTSDNKYKGIIIYFHTKEGKPFYCYKPLNLQNQTEIEKWEEETLNLYQNAPYNYTYMKYIYWKLEEYSCVLVQRNRHWFKSNIAELQEIWDIITKERINGYEHRAPNRKIKKESTIELMTKPKGGCLLQFNKESGKITIIKSQDQNSLVIDKPIIAELQNIDINI